MIRRAVSPACPACASADSRPVDRSAPLSLTPDRVCHACGERFSPPTPVWVAIGALLMGLAGLAGGAGVVGYAATDRDTFSAGAWGVMIGVAGLMLVVGSIRGLMEDPAKPRRGFTVGPPVERGASYEES